MDTPSPPRSLHGSTHLIAVGSGATTVLSARRLGEQGRPCEAHRLLGKMGIKKTNIISSRYLQELCFTKPLQTLNYLNTEYQSQGRSRMRVLRTSGHKVFINQFTKKQTKTTNKLVWHVLLCKGSLFNIYG